MQMSTYSQNTALIVRWTLIEFVLTRTGAAAGAQMTCHPLTQGHSPQKMPSRPPSAAMSIFSSMPCTLYHPALSAYRSLWSCLCCRRPTLKRARTIQFTDCKLQTGFCLSATHGWPMLVLALSGGSQPVLRSTAWRSSRAPSVVLRHSAHSAPVCQTDHLAIGSTTGRLDVVPSLSGSAAASMTARRTPR